MHRRLNILANKLSIINLKDTQNTLHIMRLAAIAAIDVIADTIIVANINISNFILLIILMPPYIIRILRSFIRNQKSLGNILFNAYLKVLLVNVRNIK